MTSSTFGHNIADTLSCWRTCNILWQCSGHLLACTMLTRTEGQCNPQLLHINDDDGCCPMKSKREYSCWERLLPCQSPILDQHNWPWPHRQHYVAPVLSSSNHRDTTLRAIGNFHSVGHKADVRCHSCRSINTETLLAGCREANE